jgi:TPR repeat protein
MVTVTIFLALLPASPAHAQTYKPTPVQECDFLASVPLRGPEGGSVGSPKPHELVLRTAEARAACEQAVKDQPKAARLYGHLARVRALAGDAAGALEAARQGAGLGSTRSQVILAVLLARGEQAPRDYGTARELLQRAAKAGDPYGHFNLGVLSANGWGVPRDDVDAAGAFSRAAHGGDDLAMQLLAQRYDTAQAERWLKRAAEDLYPDAEANPLRLPDLGAAAPDARALVAWYEARARAGEPWAQAYLGMLLEAGQWLARDYAAAARWYRLAGEAGFVQAQWRMAKFHREGRGVPRDEGEARRWGEMQQVQRCDALERANPGANACDRLAADPYDPQRATEGIDSLCMRHFAERAVPACSAAVKQAPSNMRYRAQLARALAHVGRFDEARREAAAAATQGSSAAMILLGAMSQRGLGSETDEKQALAWYRKAALAGNQRGVSMVMASAYNGMGVEKGSAEANALMSDMQGRQAVVHAPTTAEMAAKGNAREQFNLAAGLEREKKYDEAMQWYRRAAAQGFQPAELNLAQMYEKGIGVAQDTGEARKRYRRLASLGDGEARYRAASLAAGAGDYGEARALYERGVRENDWRATLDLGQMYEDGRGVPKDLARAAGLYERAEGSRWAHFKLGVLYLEGGANLPQDYAKARGWLQRSAGEGNAGARNNLGVMAERGLGARVDYAEARDLYLAALRGGNPQAKGNLEKLYAEGRGAPSGSAALDWYRTGADAGISSAQYRLGTMYARGEHVARDDQLAAQWLLRAAEQGHPQARKEAGEALYRMGRDPEAAALGHEGAARRLAEKMSAAGQPGAAEELRRFLAHAQRQAPPPRAWPEGIATDPGDDPTRTIAIRIAGAGSIQAVAVNPMMASPYDVILWFPPKK